LAGRKVASLFLDREPSRISVAVILTSPMLPALLVGHIEKVMAWGWLLLSIYFLLDTSRTVARRGMYSGLSWGIMALIGANYHFFYAGLVLIPLLLSFMNRTLLFSFIGGASVSIIHLPSVWHLIGVTRANPAQSIPVYSMDFSGIPLSLATGIAKPVGWESWALIGMPMLCLFIYTVLLDLWDIKHTKTFSLQKLALLIASILLALLATGFLYKGHHLFDTFRVPVRAISVFAIAITLYTLMKISALKIPPLKASRETILQVLLITAAIQIGIFAVHFTRPAGSMHAPYDPDAQRLAIFLNEEQATSIWLPNTKLSDMYIQVVLTQYHLALPNVYYGDMGQNVTITGPYCGYSFDYLISLPLSGQETKIDLESSLDQQIVGYIPLTNLQYRTQVSLDSQIYNVYRVVCSQ